MYIGNRSQTILCITEHLMLRKEPVVWEVSLKNGFAQIDPTSSSVPLFGKE